MEKKLEDILKERLEGYSESAPDLKDSIFKKMDERGKGMSFEQTVQSKMAGYAEKAPNLLQRIFDVRTAGYIARNRWMLRLRNIGSAAVVATVVAFSVFRAFDIDPSAVKQSQTLAVTEQEQNGGEVNSIPENNNAGVINSEVLDENVVTRGPGSTPDANTTTSYEDYQADQSVLSGNTSALADAFDGNIHEGNTNTPNIALSEDSDETQTVGNQNVSDTRTKDDPNGPTNVRGESETLDESPILLVDSEPGVSTQPEGEPELEEMAGDDRLAIEEQQDLTEDDGDIAEVVEEEEDAIIPKNDGAPRISPIRNFSIEALYAPAYASVQFGIGDDNLRRARTQSETVLYSFNAGMRFNYELNTNVELQTGLIYTNRKQKVEWTQHRDVVEQEITSRQIVIKDPIRPDRVETVYDTATTQYTVSKDISNVNTYRSLSVPILLKYTWYPKFLDNWGFAINGGVSLNVWNQRSGFVSGVNGEMQDISNDVYTQKYFRPSFQIGFGPSYRFSDRLSVFAEPSVVYGLRSISADGYGLDQFSLNRSCIVGLKVNF